LRPFAPCIPTRTTKVPSGPDWLHEIKHHGYRLIVQRDAPPLRPSLLVSKLRALHYLG
jgi:hypothetical protein